MAKWIAAEKARAGLRHAVVCPNVTGRTKEKIAQSKRARAGRSPLLISHKWRELVSSGRLVCRCHDAFSGVTFVLFCFVFVFMLSLKPRPFIQSFFILRYAGASIATRVFFLSSFCLFGDVAFSEYFLYHCRFSLCMESTTSYVFPFRMVFCGHGLDF